MGGHPAIPLPPGPGKSPPVFPALSGPDGARSASGQRRGAGGKEAPPAGHEGHYFQMVRYDHEKYSFVRYQEVGTGDRSAEFVPYHITYVPDGFICVQSRITEVSCKERFENDDGIFVFYSQTKIERAKFFVDTENAKSEEILLDNKKQVYYINGKVYQTIYWVDGEIYFRINGNISKDLLVKMAESVGDK